MSESRQQPTPEELAEARKMWIELVGVEDQFTDLCNKLKIAWTGLGQDVSEELKKELKNWEYRREKWLTFLVEKAYRLRGKDLGEFDLFVRDTENLIEKFSKWGKNTSKS